jgi:hypothetical protein
MPPLKQQNKPLRTLKRNGDINMLMLSNPGKITGKI